jgi:CheY-like chemotaxis protein
MMPTTQKRILIVDDHDDTRQVTAIALRRHGYTVSAAGTKSEALALCQHEEFDLLIGDLHLPDGNGLDLMRELAAKCKIAGIAFTGYGRAEDVAAARAAGYSAHLLKPASFNVLIETIERILAETRNAV